MNRTQHNTDEPQQRIDVCKYYRGEDNNPYNGKDQNKAMLWFYEQCWVMTHKKDISDIAVQEYVYAGLEEFEQNDGVPISLKALLFNRYAKTSYSMLDAVEPFKEFYKRYYILDNKNSR